MALSKVVVTIMLPETNASRFRLRVRTARALKDLTFTLHAAGSQKHKMQVLQPLY
jgi:hypothetical protein